ncbi:MAG: diphthamide synthesis protein [Candidatus Altiarchaeia archaeon]
MENADYDFETDRIIKEIRKKKAKRAGLQFPEGLKTYAIGIAEKLEKETGTMSVIFVDPVYGACDTKERDAELLGLDMVVHYGHTNLAPKIRRT